ncbi:MAG: FtsX-like permease family protein [Bacteroidales bacterium]|nr:FtsX-like permease family protein [Bacteroidales bacterium]
MVRDFSYFEVKIADKKFEIPDGNTTAKTAIIKFFNDTNEILSTSELGYVSANEIYRLIELGEKVHFQECYIEDFSLTDYRKNHSLLKNEIIRILGFTATHSIFHSDKELNFSFSKFTKGDVDFTNSIFLKGSLLFENCSFGNINVSFENVLFRDGNVNFSKSIFGGGNITFKNSEFFDGIKNFQNSNFGQGNLNFERVKFGNGSVLFNTSKFGEGTVDFTRSTLEEGEMLFADTTFSRGDLLFEEITKHPSIESVTLSFEPGHDFWFTLPIRRKDQPPASTKIIKGCRIDYNYFSTYQIPIVHGKNYSRDNQNDGRVNILVNEKATELLGFDQHGDALNQFLMIGDNEVQIIGIIKNFHQLKLRFRLQPVIYILATPPGYYAVRLNTSLNHQETIDHIKVRFDEFLPGNPFLYTYLDEYFNRQYRIEQTFEKVVGIFTVLAIIIASLGLFGLSSLERIQRIKEIGIRKVHGARVANILTLFSGKTLLLISISIFVAIPVTVLILNSWLQNFQFHIEIEWSYFIFPVLVMLFVSMVTVSSRIVKTANTNPAQSLRYE